MSSVSQREDIAAFQKAAERYCALVEITEERSRADLLFDLGITLSAVYAASLRLPDRDSEAEETPRMKKAYGDAYGRLTAGLGDSGGDRFWDFVNRMDGIDKKKHYRHFVDVLADDLAELYLTLKEGLALLASGRESEALSEWRLHWFLWGVYVTRSLATVHACLVAEAARGFVRDGPNFPVPPTPQG